MSSKSGKRSKAETEVKLSIKSSRKKQDIEETSDQEEEDMDDISDEEVDDDLDDIDNEGDADNQVDIDDDDGDDYDDDEEDASGLPSRAVFASSVSNEPKETEIVSPMERITSEYMTLYEYAMVIGNRATHISQGAPIFVDITGLTEARDIAIKEIREKKCPLSISRRIGNKIEIWEVNEMSILERISSSGSGNRDF
jgi:DNA-directed RNA polymerase subunit K/omega